ncbi:Holliday junction resolvase RuvX [Paraburkholderia edwinii]|jgi:putative Holliday junction resolvase|uniref:Putative pre-16S rRNA nuclease n=1 Tax=Paraburkholderia edwinii TaxID=2861782 RepID=A0ABX8UG66_9BURK|nr:Holliday junction resolvase RuvX [Paraburkholderia edwinii]QYD67875.1 Holliday junction resolvase RuvX [Paraburkholderia edwinii]
MTGAPGREATLLAFDYGEKRIGVAVGNSLTKSARPLVVVQNRNRDYRFAELGKLIGEWRPDALVVGLPMHPDGTPHAMTQQAKRFGNQLNGRFNLPVSWVDERYSSVQAEASVRSGTARADLLDAEAACIILQQYFEETGMRGEPRSESPGNPDGETGNE